MRGRRSRTASYDPSMADAACEALINRLVAEVPALKAVHDVHIAANDELLPHVFFGDVTRFVTGSFAPDTHEARDDALRVLAILEHAMQQPEPSVENLISVSFAENLVGEKCLPELRPVLGSRLKNELAYYEGGEVIP